MPKKIDMSYVEKIIIEGEESEARVLMKEFKPPAIYYLEALQSFISGHEKDALKFGKLALKEGCKSDMLLRLLGNVYVIGGIYDKALAMFSGVKKPTVDDYFMQALSSFLLGDVKGARGYLTLAIKKDKTRTAMLMKDFYNTFVAPSPDITPGEKIKLKALFADKSRFA